MKVSRIVIVAALAASCSRGTPSDRSEKPSHEAPPVATSGETAEPQVPASPSEQPREPRKVVETAPVADHAKATGVNPNAAVLADFKSRVDAYMKLRKSAVKDAPALKETKDPAKIKAAQDGICLLYTSPSPRD